MQTPAVLVHRGRLIARAGPSGRSLGSLGEMSTPYQVLVVDDDYLVRDSYRKLLMPLPQFVVVGEGKNGHEAIELYSTLRPDVVLMDLQMPDVSGIEATKEISSRWPDACIIALTSFGTKKHIIAALRAGASGYLLKDAASGSLASSMVQALAGEMPLSSSVRRELVSTVLTDEPPTRLLPHNICVTKRESELLSWLASGLTNRQIATRMYVSEGTVKQYLTKIGTKLGTSSRTQILIKSIQFNLVDPGEVRLA